MKQHLRVAAYAVCRRDSAVLLARWTGPRGPEWTLPGGGLDHGEDPRDAAVREVAEETGYAVHLDALLTIDSLRVLIDDGTADDGTADGGEPLDHHSIRIVYAAHVVGGELRHEVDGSTDMAAWVPLAEVPRLPRVSLVDIGLSAAERS